MTPDQRRWKWVKFECLPDDMKQYIRPPKSEKKTKDAAEPQKQRVKEATEVKEQVIEIEDDSDLDYTKIDNVEKILTKYKNQQTSRKNFSIEKHVEVFNLILKAQQDNLNVQIEVTNLLISTFFLMAKQTSQGFFSREIWLAANNKISDLLSLLKNKVIETKEPEKPAEQEGGEDGGDIDSFLRSTDQQILPALVNFIEKLDQQLFKALQNLDQTDIQYLYRLRDECLLVKQCDNLMAYLEQQKDLEKVARVGLIKLERIYYKHDSLYEKTRAALKGQPDKLDELYFLDKPSQQETEHLVQLVVDHCSQRLKIKAIMLQVYHHAIHNRYHEAKDLMLKTHVAKSIFKQQISNQICYNRAVVQIGLSAFRLGLFEESNQVLSEVAQNARIRETLAQGQSTHTRQQEKTLEEEIEEKKRLVPAHLQINLEQLESAYFITSMMLEVVNISENKFTIQKKVISRTFRKLMELYDSKGIQFVAQSNRDFIVQAARQLHQSDWQAAMQSISSIKLLTRMTEFQEGALKTLLQGKLKEIALRVYLIESQSMYQSFNLSTIQSQFDLDKA
jgi:hypothetical protein